MAFFAKMKRVIYPLDDKVKARIVGPDYYISSGSEHSAEEANSDAVSPSLSDLVFNYHQNDHVHTSPENDQDYSERSSPSMYDSTDTIEDLMINPMVNIKINADSFRDVVLFHVSRAMEAFSYLKVEKSIIRRNVTGFLRNIGYNAGVCKTKWESCGGLTAGNYEFIDVIRSDPGNQLVTRYFVDLDFTGEFQIARPTSQYEKVLQYLPRVFVGKSEDLKMVLKVVSNEVKRSLKRREMYLPPWRKHRFVQNKYFGPYRRTLNFLTASSSALSETVRPGKAVKCRFVGFDAVDGGVLFPATTAYKIIK